jgi:hypothetical protein
MYYSSTVIAEFSSAAEMGSGREKKAERKWEARQIGDKERGRMKNRACRKYK